MHINFSKMWVRNLSKEREREREGNIFTNQYISSEKRDPCFTTNCPGRTIWRRSCENESNGGERDSRQVEGIDGQDGRRGTYDKERRAPVAASDDGDILATTSGTRHS